MTTITVHGDVNASDANTGVLDVDSLTPSLQAIKNAVGVHLVAGDGVTVGDNGSSFTINVTPLPQGLSTTDSPTFAGMTATSVNSTGTITIASATGSITGNNTVTGNASLNISISTLQHNGSTLNLGGGSAASKPSVVAVVGKYYATKLTYTAPGNTQASHVATEFAEEAYPYDGDVNLVNALWGLGLLNASSAPTADYDGPLATGTRPNTCVVQNHYNNWDGQGWSQWV